MNVLGDLFDNITVVNGHVAIYSLCNKNTYLIGENHQVSAYSKSPTHIWNIIQEYAKTNTTKKISIVIEAAPSDFQIIRTTTNSILKTIIDSTIPPSNINFPKR